MNKHCLQYDEYNQLFDFYRKSIFKDFFYSSENCVYSRKLYRIKMNLSGSFNIFNDNCHFYSVKIFKNQKWYSIKTPKLNEVFES